MQISYTVMTAGLQCGFSFQCVHAGTAWHAAELALNAVGQAQKERVESAFVDVQTTTCHHTPSSDWLTFRNVTKYDDDPAVTIYVLENGAHDIVAIANTFGQFVDRWVN